MDENNRGVEEGEEEEEDIEVECAKEDYDDDDNVDDCKDKVVQMTPPKVSTWINESDGTTLTGVVVMDWGSYYEPSNTYSSSVFDDNCPICSQPLTGAGKHRICYLPCGHMYGLSCINNWIQQQSQSTQSCPQCNTLCTLKDVRLLYPALADPSLHKASTTRFPFTEEGFRAFKRYVSQRHDNALQLRADTYARQAVVWKRWHNVADRKCDVLQKIVDLYNHRQRGGRLTDDSERWLLFLERRNKALKRRADTLRRRAYALGRKNGILKQRAKACKASMEFFEQRYKEHVVCARENTKLDLSKITGPRPRPE